MDQPAPADDELAAGTRLVDRADDIEIIDNAADQRYEAWLDGELAGVIVYVPQDGWLVFDHTEVLPAFEGRGVASRLARAALDDVRARRLHVNPKCPFVMGYIQRHPADRDLVVGIRGPHTAGT
jgi:predicted GNAT family acetyltransferase